MACGEGFSFALAELGDVYGWGRGREGQLGQGDRKDSLVPQKIQTLKHERIVQVDAANYHTIALAGKRGRREERESTLTIIAIE